MLLLTNSHISPTARYAPSDGSGLGRCILIGQGVDLVGATIAEAKQLHLTLGQAIDAAEQAGAGQQVPVEAAGLIAVLNADPAEREG